MKKNFIKLSFKLIVVLFIIAISDSIAFAYVWGNWRECASAPGCSCTLTLQLTQDTGSQLKTYVVESAGYFLKSHAAYQEFLNRVEMSDINGVDYKELREILYSTIENMENASVAYSNLKTASEKIPYNRKMIKKLKKFDYDGFRAKYGLLSTTFAKVRKLLRKGDVPGLDAAVLDNMDTILSKLYEIKAAVDKDQAPEIALLWRANQDFIETQLFGQYVSEVFKANL